MMLGALNPTRALVAISGIGPIVLTLLSGKQFE